MMAVLRRLLGAEQQSEQDQARERERQYQLVREGLQDAARRVRLLEIEADVRSRSINIRQSERKKR